MSLNDVSGLQAQQAAQQSSDQELKNLQAKVGSLKKGPPDKRAGEEKKLKEACEGFESIFIKQLWKEMRATVPKEDILHSREEDQWKDMLDDEMSKKMASENGIGLKDVLFSQLKDRLTRVSKAMPGAPIEAQPVRPLRNPDGISLKKTAVGPLPGRGEAVEPASEAAPVGQAAEPPKAVSVQGLGEGSGDVLSRVNALASRIELERSKDGQTVQAAEAASPVQVASGTSAPAGQADSRADASGGNEAGSQAANQAKPATRTGFQTGMAAGLHAEAGMRNGSRAFAPSGAQVAAAMSRPAQSGQTGARLDKPAAPAETPVSELKPAAKDLETLSRLGQELLRGNMIGAASLEMGTDEG